PLLVTDLNSRCHSSTLTPHHPKTVYQHALAERRSRPLAVRHDWFRHGLAQRLARLNPRGGGTQRWSSQRSASGATVETTCPSTSGFDTGSPWGLARLNPRGPAHAKRRSRPPHTTTGFDTSSPSGSPG